MNSSEKVLELRKKIFEKLHPLIDNDYILLDLPYHSNLGDTLIWEGELDFLKTIPYKCKYCTWHKGNIDCVKKHINSSTIILLHGGGNFGDIWPEIHHFRNKILAMFPKHKIIIFPQTIYYNDKTKLINDSKTFEKYSNLTICARDNNSFEILKNYFPKNTSLLVPDMAFFINKKKFKKYPNPSGSLFLKRTDKEFKDNDCFSIIPDDVCETDWIWLKDSPSYRIKDIILRYLTGIDNRLNTDLKNLFHDYYWRFYLKNLNVRTAVKLLSHYEKIYTTRMHAGILSLLLDKTNVTFFDNSYGKLSSFYETWLKDVDDYNLIV